MTELALYDSQHEQPSGLARWLFSTNHKDIGTLYLLFSLTMFFVGGSFAMVIRAELFQPGLQFVDPLTFNQMTTMHALVMIFGAVMPAFVGLANWLIPGREPGSIGGAMDLAFGAKRLVIVMTHTTKENEPKILKKCTYELTAPRCVSTIITDIAVIDVTPDGLVLKETAPGWTAEEVQKLTEPKLKVSPNLKDMEL